MYRPSDMQIWMMQQQLWILTDRLRSVSVITLFSTAADVANFGKLDVYSSLFEVASALSGTTSRRLALVDAEHGNIMCTVSDWSLIRHLHHHSVGSHSFSFNFALYYSSPASASALLIIPTRTGSVYFHVMIDSHTTPSATDIRQH